MKRKQLEISKNLLNDNQSKTVYPSMRMVRRVRHWFKKPVKAVFDAESNPDYMDSEKKEVGLGLIESDKDDLVHEIHAKKEFVLDLRKEGVSLELFELES